VQGHAPENRSNPPRSDRRPRRLLGRGSSSASCAARTHTAASASASTRTTSRGDSRPAEHHATGRRQPDPQRLLRGRRGHRDDQHVHGDDDRAGGLCVRRRRRARNERRRRASCTSRRRRLDGAHTRQATLRRRRRRTAQRDPFAFTQGGGSRVPCGQLRAGPRRVRASDPGLARRRRRPAPCRDRLRLVEREGTRSSRRWTRRRSCPCGSPSPRSTRAAVNLSGQTVEAFWLSVQHANPLIVGVNCSLGAAEDAALRGRHGRHRDDLGRVLSERRPAERVRPARRAAARHQPPARRVRPRRARQRRRRLLRHDARPCAGHLGCGGRCAAEGASGASTRHAFQRPGAVRDYAGHELRDDRRAQRTSRGRPFPPARRGRRVAGGARSRTRTGPGRGESARRQHGRRPPRRAPGDDDVPEPRRDRAGGRPDCRSWSTAPAGRCSRPDSSACRARVSSLALAERGGRQFLEQAASCAVTERASS